MDLSSILPLLMANNKNKEFMNMFSSAKGDDPLKSALPKDPKTQAIVEMLKKTSQSKKPVGLTPIEDFAPNEFLGMFLRYYG